MAYDDNGWRHSIKKSASPLGEGRLIRTAQFITAVPIPTHLCYNDAVRHKLNGAADFKGNSERGRPVRPGRQDAAAPSNKGVKTMLEIVQPKNYINILAGMVSIAFTQIEKVRLPLPKADVTVAVAETTADDLTVITGIGPTFAKRLQAAGIRSYQDLAAASPAHVKKVAQLADWQADPKDWIAEARTLA